MIWSLIIHSTKQRQSNKKKTIIKSNLQHSLWTATHLVPKCNQVASFRTNNPFPVTLETRLNKLDHRLISHLLFPSNSIFRIQLKFRIPRDRISFYSSCLLTLYRWSKSVPDRWHFSSLALKKQGSRRRLILWLDKVVP